MRHNNSSYNLTSIKDWCVFILKFFHSKDKTEALYENLIRETLKYYDDNNKKELNSMLRTVYSIAFTSPETDKTLLNEVLMKEFGKKLEDITPKPIKHRALKGEKLEQLKFMGAWCTAIMEYLKKTVPSDPTGFFSGSIYAIIKTVEANDIRGMKMCYNDINEMARGLSGKQLNELNKILHKKFDKSLVEEEKASLKKIDHIIMRGRLVSDEEFYLIQSFFDDLIIADDKVRIEKLNKILLNYK